MNALRSFAATLDRDTAAEIAEAMEEIFRYPCAVVSIVGDLDNVSVGTNLRVELKNGAAVQVDLDTEGNPALGWTIDDCFGYLRSHPGNPVRFSWNGSRLRIRFRSGAGLEIAWIYAPDFSAERRES